MANVFKDISQFTLKSAATGSEEFQVSATEKVTAQQIANKVQLSNVIMSGFSALRFTGIEKIKDNNSLFGAVAILYDLMAKGNIKLVSNGSTEYGLVSMGNVNSTNHGFGWLLSISEKAIYIKNDFTSPNPSTLNNIQWVNAIKTGEKVSLDGGIKTVEITDFAIPGLNITKDGESFLFYANDASNIPNSNHGATSFVGVAIASPIFITGDQRLLYYMMIDTARGMFYTGRANLEDDVVAWNDTPVTRLGQAVQVTAFTEGALSSLLHTFKAGDFIPFYTGNVTASTANQFPESGAFNGFISMGSNEGDYFQIFAFKSGSPNAYMGACIGSTTQWTKASRGLNVYTISESESRNQKIDASRVEELKKSELVLFPNEVGYTPYFKVSVDNSKAYFITGIIPINSQDQPGLNNGEEPPFEQLQTVMIEVDLTTYDITIQPYPVVKKEWLQLSAGGSSAVEKLSTWLEQGTEVAPHINISLGEVQVPLNRALKESDILRIDFMRRSEASTFYMQGVAIVHVGAVDNSIQGYAAALDEQYVDYGTGEFAALAFNPSTKLIGHNYFNLHIDTNGSAPQDDYYIMGVYNISGK